MSAAGRQVSDGYDQVQGYAGGGDGIAPPASSSIHIDERCDRVALIVCDRASSDVAENVSAQLKREAQQHGRLNLEVDERVIEPGEHHRDVLQSMLTKFPHVPLSSVHVLSFLADGNPDEFRATKQWAQSTKPPLAAHVVTCTKAMQDTTLLIRNVCKAVIVRLAP
eukprot:TRINITY_DN7535_c2_g1_i2.p1 TRINITY_DN7535_c2_g1~~TRINITY_DN7535_c2_g1_i2.p1  ORF type:complete len:166 (+),score=29.91 TRINITY_DN7535_c2_g1_i2:97-594(+)